MASVHEREKSLQIEISEQVQARLPDVDVLAVELSGPERFTVYVDHPEGVDHALCERVTNVLRGYLDRYSIEVSSPGFRRPLRKPDHFRDVVGRPVVLRTERRKRLRGEVRDAGERAVIVQTQTESVEVPYTEIVRANLIDEGNE